MDTCIYCDVEPLDSRISEEHIIPQVLGGWKTCACVCKTHNHRFGLILESKLKKNAFVAHALHLFGLQSAYAAFRQANISLQTPGGPVLKGQIKEGKPMLVPTLVPDAGLIVPEESAKQILRRRIENTQKPGNDLVSWRDADFDSAPYDELCRIEGTDIAFKKNKGGAGVVRFEGLDEAIPFRVPAKIALTHLSWLGWPFAHSSALAPLKLWILNGGENRFVLLRRRMNDLDPHDLHLKPFHYVKYQLIDGHLLAIVTLFSAIQFGVYLAEIPEIAQWPDTANLARYHVYDLHKKSIDMCCCDAELEEEHSAFLDTVRWVHGPLPQ